MAITLVGVTICRRCTSWSSPEPSFLALFTQLVAYYVRKRIFEPLWPDHLLWCHWTRGTYCPLSRGLSGRWANHLRPAIASALTHPLSSRDHRLTRWLSHRTWSPDILVWSVQAAHFPFPAFSWASFAFSLWPSVDLYGVIPLFLPPQYLCRARLLRLSQLLSLQLVVLFALCYRHQQALILWFGRPAAPPVRQTYPNQRCAAAWARSTCGWCSLWGSCLLCRARVIFWARTAPSTSAWSSCSVFRAFSKSLAKLA